MEKVQRRPEQKACRIPGLRRFPAVKKKVIKRKKGTI
jgi:hypothetical protein